MFPFVAFLALNSYTKTFYIYVSYNVLHLLLVEIASFRFPNIYILHSAVYVQQNENLFNVLKVFVWSFMARDIKAPII